MISQILFIVCCLFMAFYGGNSFYYFTPYFLAWESSIRLLLLLKFVVRKTILGSLGWSLIYATSALSLAAFLMIMNAQGGKGFGGIAIIVIPPFWLAGVILGACLFSMTDTVYEKAQ